MLERPTWEGLLAVWMRFQPNGEARVFAGPSERYDHEQAFLAFARAHTADGVALAVQADSAPVPLTDEETLQVEVESRAAALALYPGRQPSTVAARGIFADGYGHGYRARRTP